MHTGQILGSTRRDLKPSRHHFSLFILFHPPYGGPSARGVELRGGEASQSEACGTPAGRLHLPQAHLLFIFKLQARCSRPGRLLTILCFIMLLLFNIERLTGFLVQPLPTVVCYLPRRELGKESARPGEGGKALRHRNVTKEQGRARLIFPESFLLTSLFRYPA